MTTRYWHPFADMAAVARDGELVLVDEVRAGVAEVSQVDSA